MPSKKEEVTGPYNIVRLEGEVNGIKKVLYTFFDFHFDEHAQTECDDPTADTIKQYLAKNMLRIEDNDKQYDFFLEVSPTELLYDWDKGNYKYILSLRKLFKYQQDNRSFTNTRFHYADLRDYTTSLIPKDLKDYLDEILCKKYLHPDLEKHFTTILYFINLATKAMDGTEKKSKDIKPLNYDELKTYEVKDLDQNAKYLINKAFNKYNHKNIKKKVVPVFKKEISSHFDRVRKEIKKIRQIIKDMNKAEDDIKKKGGVVINNHYSKILPYSEFVDYLYEIYKSLQAICLYYMYGFGRVMDLYFIRRFLDKDYITNAVMYSGSAHSTNYVHFLVNHMDFKVTHAAYSSVPINKINNEIKKLKNKSSVYLNKIFNDKPTVQCSDISSFPDLFE